MSVHFLLFTLKTPPAALILRQEAFFFIARFSGFNSLAAALNSELYDSVL